MKLPRLEVLQDPEERQRPIFFGEQVERLRCC